MVLLTGFKKKKTAVFISGKGSNLKSLLKFSRIKRSPISINLIISDNVRAKGLIYAKIFGLKKKIFDFKKRKLTENKLISELKKNNIELICLAGFMKILSKNFIRNFNGKILNIHPSLLPKYKGLNTHARVLKSKEKFSGCTVHYVSPKLDSGKIILQKKVKIYQKETLKTLKKKVLKQEHRLYPEAILKIFNL